MTTSTLLLPTGIEISSNYKPTKWWSFNASFDLYSQMQTGIAERLDTT